MGLSGCVADIGSGSIRVDVHGWGVGRQIYVAGAAVNDGSVGETGFSWNAEGFGSRVGVGLRLGVGDVENNSQ